MPLSNNKFKNKNKFKFNYQNKINKMKMKMKIKHLGQRYILRNFLGGGVIKGLIYSIYSLT